MNIADSERIKQREILFQALYPRPDQASLAADFLTSVEGILETDAVAPLLLRVRYDVLRICLRDIEEALTELGLHLDTRLFLRVRRALHYYTEETLRANCGCPHGTSNCTRKVFAVRYQAIEHGCRDRRPEHWRRYL